MENKTNHVSPIHAAFASIGIGVIGFGACCLFLSWGLTAVDIASAVPWLLAALFAGVITGFAISLIDKDQAVSRNERHLKSSGDYDETTSRAEVNLSRAAMLAPPTTAIRRIPDIAPPKPVAVNAKGRVTNPDLFGVGQPQMQWRPLLAAGSGEVIEPVEIEEPEPVLVEPSWIARERKAASKSQAWASNQERIGELAQLIFRRVRYHNPTTANIQRVLGPSGPGRLITGTSDITAAMQILAAQAGEGKYPLAQKRGEGTTSAWRWVNQTTGECDELND